VFENVTKYVIGIKRIDEIPQWIKNAFYIATTGRPGPVVIDIPRDIFYEKNGRDKMARETAC